MSNVSRRDKVINGIKERIAKGEYAPGAALPTHEALAAEYKVGMTTVRSAIMVLKAERYVIGEQGVAVRVAPEPPQT